MMKFALCALSLAVASPAFAQSSPTVPQACAQSVVTTGGQAVIAIAPGNIKTAAIISNPASATESIFVNAAGTATGTAGGTNFEITPGGTPWVSGPINTSVSVYAATSNHAFNCQVQ